MEIESRVAQEALRVWGFKKARQETKYETAGGRVLQTVPGATLPVHLQSFSREVAPLGRMGPRLPPSSSSYAEFWVPSLPSALEQGGKYGDDPGGKGGPERRTQRGGAHRGLPGGGSSRRPRTAAPIGFWSSRLQ
jgi:hypothetical protein